MTNKLTACKEKLKIELHEPPPKPGLILTFTLKSNVTTLVRSVQPYLGQFCVTSKKIT